MKKFFLTASFALAATVLVPVTAFAQPDTPANNTVQAEQTPEEFADKKTVYVHRACGLSETQKTQVYQMLLNEANQLQLLKEKHGDNTEAFEADRDELAQKMHTKIKAVLTPEQQANYDKLVAAKKK